MRTLVTGAVLLSLLCACLASGPNPSAPRRPNLVVILADDMGYGDPGCYNARSRIPTPHIDRLAREGMRFTDAHAPGALCVPSRYGLLSGRYPCRAPHLSPGKGPVLEAGSPTLASLLRDAGYATAMVGKWHLGFEGGPDTDGADLFGGPLDRGFDRFFGMHASLDIPPYFFIRDRTPVAPPTQSIAASASSDWTHIQGAFWREGAVAPGFVHAEVHGRFEAEALAYLEDRADSDEPFFLYLALAAPHTPWLPGPAFAGTTEVGSYGDFVAQVDGTVGRVLDALDQHGQARDTVVVFTSDNGPVWYPADVERFDHAAVGPLRGMKADAWEGGHRMPFVVRWPARVSPGTTSEALVCFTDLLATGADLAGVSLDAAGSVDSHSLMPALLDSAAETTRRDVVLKGNATAIREERWKLIRHLGSGGFSRPGRVEPGPGEPAGQLYDLHADPGETRNLWSAYPEVVERLSARLDSYDAR